MPQSSQKKSSHVVTNNVSMMSLNSRRRVDRLNEGEHVKLILRASQMERHLRVIQHQQERLMARVNRSRNELLAYQTLLNTELKADQFHTLRLGYDVKAARKDPHEKKRLGLETKIYHSGFNRHVLRKKIDTHVTALIPENKNKELRQRKIELMKQKNAPFIVDRHTKSLTVIFNKFSHHKNNPGLSMKEHPKLPSIEAEHVTEEENSTEKKEKERVVKEKIITLPTIEQEHVEEENATEKKEEERVAKEKIVTLPTIEQEHVEEENATEKKEEKRVVKEKIVTLPTIEQEHVEEENFEEQEGNYL